MVVEAIGRPDSRARRLWYRVLGFLAQPPGMRNDSLDDTSVRRRRSDDADPAAFRATGTGINFPTGLLLFLLGQLVGGIWWAATLQSDMNHEIQDRAKEEARLWQTVETYRLQVEALRIEVARSSPSIQIRRTRPEKEEE
jgi:hypothetical protein